MRSRVPVHESSIVPTIALEYSIEDGRGACLTTKQQKKYATP